MSLAAHRKHRRYSRWARILKARWRERFAPKVSDWQLDRQRVGEHQERRAQSAVRPDRTVFAIAGAAGLSPVHIKSARGAVTPGRVTTKRGS